MGRQGNREDFKKMTDDDFDLFDYLEDDEDFDGLADKYLSFTIGDEFYGIDVRSVSEIIEMQPISVLPGVPPYIRGIIKRRGKIIPAADVRLRFGMEPREYNKRTCIIIIHVQDNEYGIIVDSVNDAYTLGAGDIVPAPSNRKISADSRYIRGIGYRGEKMEIILDAQRLIVEDDIQTISASLVRTNQASLNSVSQSQ